MTIINNSWDNILNIELIKEKLSIIEEKSKTDKILPLKGENSDIVLALKLTDFKKVKVLIIGQDPYPNEEDAHGLAFSKKNGEFPDSLKNIFNKIKEEYGIDNKNGNLTSWANQGVLLLNRALTYSPNESLAKRNKFWQPVIDDIITQLINRKKPLVILLWGNPANQLFTEKDEYYLENNILVLRSSHPSMLGYKKETVFGSFYNCKHFSLCNNFLKSHNIKEIDWSTN